MITVAGRQFVFRPMLTVIAVISLGLLLSLGMWQLARLDWKLSLIEQVEARIDAAPKPLDDVLGDTKSGQSLEYAPVTASGQFDVTRAQRVFGAIEGRPGYFVFAPLETKAGAEIYVNLGFVPQHGVAAADIAPIPSGEAVIEGLYRNAERPRPPASWFVSTKQSPDKLWFVRDPALFRQAAKTDAGPTLVINDHYIDSYARDSAQWPLGGTTRLDFNNRHLEYALTWFGLAATLVGVWFAFSLQALSKSNNFKK